MTREEAKEKWEIIKAYGEGKTIQFYGASGEWHDIEEGFELPVEEKLRIKENRKVKYCYLCGADKPEFTVASKHIFCMLERCKKFDSGTSHITIHICEDCFLKMFDKEIKENERSDIK